MKTTRILFLMAVVLSVALQAEAKKVKLQYQLKTGDEFKYEMTTNQDIAQEVMGQSQNSTVNTSMTYAFKVLGSTPAGDFLMQASLFAYSLSTATPMGDMKYNSATDTVVPDFARTTSAGIGELYTFNLSPLGKITDMKEPAGLVEKINKIANELGASQMQMGAASASQAFTTAGFQQTMESLLIAFPEEGAEIKKPWEEKSKINQSIAFNVVAKLELVKASPTVNELNLTAQIFPDPDAPAMEMQGMNITYELLGAKDGNMKLDAVTGLLITVDATTSISGNVSIDSPQLPSPMSIPMTIRSVEKVIKK